MSPKLIPYSRQRIESDDIDAVVDTLKSDFLTTGPIIERFERNLAEYVGAQYAVAVANGTAALHIATLALELEKGMQGLTCTNSFLSSANCLHFCGLEAGFCDIDPDTFNISPESLAEKTKENTKIVIPVHFAGRACDMAPIHQMMREKGIAIIEDASHALGATFKNGKKVGSCEHSDMTTFSFHPLKSITTGEGGAVTTNDENLYRKLLQYRSHGVVRDPQEFRTRELAFTDHESPNPWYYEQHNLGYNYRLTELQAALGQTQLLKLDRFIARRREIAHFYMQSLKDLSHVQLPLDDCLDESAWHLFVLRIDFPKIAKTRAEVMLALRERGVATQVHYIPIHLQHYYYEQEKTRAGDFPNAENYYNQCISIPIHQSMTDIDVERVVESVKLIIRE